MKEAWNVFDKGQTGWLSPGDFCNNIAPLLAEDIDPLKVYDADPHSVH